MRTVDIRYTLLLDYYGALLPLKQQELAKLYHYDDLSLSEIADTLGITRQGVLDGLERAEKKLREYDEALGLIERDRELAKNASEIKKCAEALLSGNDRGLCERIIAVCDKISLKG